MLTYKNIISLGYSCETATLLLKQAAISNGKITSSVFDRMATPMWAVTQLVANNFVGLLDNVQPMTIFQNFPEQWLVDTQYYIRLFPKNIESTQYIKYKEAVLAKALNFTTMLTTAAAAQTPVLFVRTQEPTSYPDYGNRIMYPQYQSQYEQTEYDYLKQFSQFIKSSYPTLQFQIMFMSDKGVFADEINNIVGITKPTGDYRHPQIATLIENHVVAHQDHLIANMGQRFISRTTTVKPVVKAKTEVPKPAIKPKPKIKVVGAYYHYHH